MINEKLVFFFYLLTACVLGAVFALLSQANAMPFWNLDLNQPSATCDLTTTYPSNIAPWGQSNGLVRWDCGAGPSSLTGWDPIGTGLASQSYFFNFEGNNDATPMFTSTTGNGHLITNYYYNSSSVLSQQSLFVPATGDLQASYFGSPFFFRGLNPQMYGYSLYQFNSNGTITAIQYTYGLKLDGYMFHNRGCTASQNVPCAIQVFDFQNNYAYIYSGNFFPLLTGDNFGGRGFSGIINGSRLPDLVFTFPVSAYSGFRGTHPPEGQCDYNIMTFRDSDGDYICFNEDAFISTGIIAPVFPTGGVVPPPVTSRTGDVPVNPQCSRYGVAMQTIHEQYGPCVSWSRDPFYLDQMELWNMTGGANIVISGVIHGDWTGALLANLEDYSPACASIMLQARYVYNNVDNPWGTVRHQFTGDAFDAAFSTSPITFTSRCQENGSGQIYYASTGRYDWYQFTSVSSGIDGAWSINDISVFGSLAGLPLCTIAMFTSTIPDFRGIQGFPRCILENIYDNMRLDKTVFSQFLPQTMQCRESSISPIFGNALLTLFLFYYLHKLFFIFYVINKKG